MTAQQRFVLRLVSAALRGVPFVREPSDDEIDMEAVVRLLLRYRMELLVQAVPEQDACLRTVTGHPALERERSRALLRSIRREHFWEALCASAEQSGVDLLAFKGIVTRELYPEPEMRPMGDIDLLYRPEQRTAMRSAVEAVGVQRYQTGLKHDHVLFPGGVHVEMHSAIVDALTEYEPYYRTVWDRAVALDGFRHLYTLPREDHYIYTLVHMREHVRKGEFMFKMATDLYLMRSEKMDEDYLRAELKKLGLASFAANMEHVVTCWFEGTLAPDDPCFPLSEYLLGNYSFGSVKTTAGEAASRYGSRLGFYMCRAFPPYRQMVTMFTWLRGRPVLLPAAWILRIGSAFGKPPVVRAIWKSGLQIDAHAVEQGARQDQFFRRYGL